MTSEQGLYRENGVHFKYIFAGVEFTKRREDEVQVPGSSLGIQAGTGGIK